MIWSLFYIQTAVPQHQSTRSHYMDPHRKAEYSFIHILHPLNHLQSCSALYPSMHWVKVRKTTGHERTRIHQKTFLKIKRGMKLNVDRINSLIAPALESEKVYLRSAVLPLFFHSLLLSYPTLRCLEYQ